MKELWQNERSKAGISLALWGVFILFVIVLASCGNNKNDSLEKPIVNNQAIEEQLKSLFNNNINFKMTIESNDMSTKKIYDVTLNNNIYEGYVEDSSGINKFRCDMKCYKVFLDHEEEEELFYNELILNIDYLKYENITLKKESDVSYVYSNEEETIKIITKEDKIAKIVRETDNHKIVFDFNYNFN